MEEILLRNFNIAFDIAHAFVKVKGNNDELIRQIKLLKENTVHYHLVDSLGIEYDCLKLGTGKINLKNVKKL